MDKEQAKNIIIQTFENKFDKNNFIVFLKNLLKSFEEKPFIYQGNIIPDAFEQYISSLERIGKYNYDNKEIDLLIVKLKRGTSIERARTMQRNFIAWYLKGSRGGKLRDAALVSFVSPDNEDWRFSLVKMDYRFEETSTGKVKVKEEFTPAKRWSFLVGKNEKIHTAESRFLPIIEDDNFYPTLEDLEQAFNVEKVTKEFFEKYRDLFIKTKLELDKVAQTFLAVAKEFQSKNINTVDFAKKLLGQITFLYFLQKKGWFGVPEGKKWSEGNKNFMRSLFNNCKCETENLFNDYLAPLFYDTLNNPRSNQADPSWSEYFKCKMPFLNGGLFEPIYDWENVKILIPNELFSNTNRTKEGDNGDGILDVFDRYNFTVNEEEPLEKEVALDPELLGKIYEKLNAIRQDNFDEYMKVLKSGKKGEETKFNKEYGVYYTPREIVHYMCQESLINYLYTELNQGLVSYEKVGDQQIDAFGNIVKSGQLDLTIEHKSGITISKEDIETLIKHSEPIIENEIIAKEKIDKIQKAEIKSSIYKSKLPKSIIVNAKLIDEKLANIKVCDPAVGSGAFPIGMMHEIVRLRELLAIYYSSTDIPVRGKSNTDIPVCEESDTGIPAYEEGDVQITQRNLPHWTKSNSIYWVTFRLADSLPQEKINQWKGEYEIWLKNNPKPWDENQWKEYDKKFGNQFEYYLDKGYGSCILGKPEVRKILMECLFKFHNIRHSIHAVVIMPNHVHLLIEPFSGYSLSELLKGIKGASAHYINKHLHLENNKVWMEESYDHIVRSEKQYFHFIRYIKENPIKANLSEDKYSLYVTQASVNNVTQAFLPVNNVTQAFLPVNEPQTQTGMSELPSQTEMSEPQTQTGTFELQYQTRMSELHYDLKLHAIENSLYGVDIDPGAIETCKLRFWLSMIVDEEDFHKIKPLPNLDYKVVCGNSLLGVEKDLFNQKAFSKLEELKPQYFNETITTKKQQLKNEINKLIYEITKGHKEFDFEVYFSEVFHKKDGFDIVIGNPPYIQLQKDGGKLAKMFEHQKYDTFSRMGDIYALFYEKGLQLLKSEGHLCFITSNKWMRAGYGEELRKFFQKYNPKILIDLGPGIFESATVDTNIIIIQKKQTNQKELKAVTLQRQNGEPINIETQLKERGVILNNLTKDAWFIGSSAEQKLKEKIERIGKPLKDWDVNIYFGIKTGLNEAFIIDSKKREEILANCKDEAEHKRTEAIIKPILRGRDIKRYHYEWAGLGVIGTFPVLQLNIDDYPAIKKHFLDNFDIRQLEQSGKKYPELGFNARKKTGNKWFETQDQIAYYPEFEKEKVVWNRIASKKLFSFVKEPILIQDSMHFFVGNNLKFICGVINSNLVAWLMELIVGNSIGGNAGNSDNVKKIPIPPITPSNQTIVQQIESLVDKILTAKKEYPQSDTSEWEREIDRLVYSLYGLTEEEIKIIKNK